MDMRQSLTVVLERNATLTGSFATEPYEVAWAAEARWFVRTLETSADEPRLVVRPQISPDGLHWCDLEPPRTIEGALASWTSESFGGWLRLAGAVEPGHASDVAAPSAKVLVYLALKS